MHLPSNHHLLANPHMGSSPAPIQSLEISSSWQSMPTYSMLQQSLWRKAVSFSSPFSMWVSSAAFSFRSWVPYPIPFLYLVMPHLTLSHPLHTYIQTYLLTYIHTYMRQSVHTWIHMLYVYLGNNSSECNGQPLSSFLVENGLRL